MPVGWIHVTPWPAHVLPYGTHAVRHTVDPGYNCEIVQRLKSEDVVQLVGACQEHTKPGLCSPSTETLCGNAHLPSQYWKVKAGSSEIQGHPQLCSVF